MLQVANILIKLFLSLTSNNLMSSKNNKIHLNSYNIGWYHKNQLFFYKYQYITISIEYMYLHTLIKLQYINNFFNDD